MPYFSFPNCNESKYYQHLYDRFVILLNFYLQFDLKKKKNERKKYRSKSIHTNSKRFYELIKPDLW